MFRYTLYFILLLGLFFEVSHANSRDYSEPSFRFWVDQLKEKAKNHGISDATINAALSDSIFLESVIELDQKQPYKTLTFEEYKKRVVPDSRVQKAREFYQQHYDLLQQVGNQYGVQPRFIVALWGIESNFGSNMGGFNIIDSLVTLSFDGRREEFFTKELMSALQIIDEGHISYEDMKGSWAGAMGQTQFMPSSFIELAADYNGDGKRDIWNTHADVFASIANYLSKRGWDSSTTWGRQVVLPANFDKNLLTRDVTKSLQEWNSLNVTRLNGSPLPNRADLTASIITPEDNGKEAYLIYSNYNTILKWNRSLYFATAVGILSDRLSNL